MNIHLPAILGFTRGTRFWHTAICFQCVNPDHLGTVETQEAQQWIEEHQGQLKAGEAGDSAQGGPSEDPWSWGQDFDSLSNNQLSKEDPFFIYLWLSNGNFSDSECLWPAIEGWGCGRGRLVACRGGGGRWKVAAGSRKDTWLQHLDQFTVRYSGEMELFSFHVRIYLAVALGRNLFCTFGLMPGDFWMGMSWNM